MFMAIWSVGACWLQQSSWYDLKPRILAIKRHSSYAKLRNLCCTRGNWKAQHQSWGAQPVIWGPARTHGSPSICPILALALWTCRKGGSLDDLWIILGGHYFIFLGNGSWILLTRVTKLHIKWSLATLSVFSSNILILYNMDRLKTFQIFKSCFPLD